MTTNKGLSQIPVEKPEKPLIDWLEGESQLRHQMAKFKTESTILFADMADSTSYKRKHDLFSGFVKTCRHNFLVLNTATDHSGIRIKEIGDEVMCRFDDANTSSGICNAILAAANVLRAFDKQNTDIKEPIDMVRSRMAIHLATEAVPYPHENSIDLVGPCIDLAARIASEAKPCQILISEETYAHLSRLNKKQLSSQGIAFSSVGKLTGLKGILDGATDVREVIWNSKERGIGREPRIQVLAEVSVKAGRSLLVLSKLREKLPPACMVGGGVIFGSKELFLRLQAKDLSEYRDIIVEGIQGVDGITMTYSNFIFPDYLNSTRRYSNDLEYTALVLIRSADQRRASYDIFFKLKQLAESSRNSRSRKKLPEFEILEAGVLFGEYEVYAIIQVNDEPTLANIVFDHIQSESKLILSTTTCKIVTYPKKDSCSPSFFWNGLRRGQGEEL